MLFGVVTDPAARTIAGCRVTLKHNATGSSREYVTDERGVYFFTFLPPGAYTMQFQADGFKQYQDTDVRVQVAQVSPDSNGHRKCEGNAGISGLRGS